MAKTKTKKVVAVAAPDPNEEWERKQALRRREELENQNRTLQEFEARISRLKFTPGNSLADTIAADQEAAAKIQAQVYGAQFEKLAELHRAEEKEQRKNGYPKVFVYKRVPACLA